MNNRKNIVKGFLLLSFLIGLVIATPVKADNNGNKDSFLSAHASLKADALIKLESSTGVIFNPDGSIRVIGAKISSIIGGDISATILFGNSSLNFVVKTNTETKLNGKPLTSVVILSQLKAGDSISFAGKIASSTSASIVINGDNVISQTLYNNNNGKIENKTSFEGEVKSINIADNTFTLKLKSGVIIKVVVSSETIIMINNTTGTLSSLKELDKVKVIGDLNTDGNVFTASKVSVENNTNDNNAKSEQKENGGGWFGKMLNWFWK